MGGTGANFLKEAHVGLCINLQNTAAFRQIENWKKVQGIFWSSPSHA